MTPFNRSLLALASLGVSLGASLALPGTLHAQRPATPSATAAGFAAPPADSARDARLARADRARIRGRSDATTWVVVISDFQCPYCKKWHDETESLIDRDYVRTGKVQIAYINYPIASIHANAQEAHEVAMCAAEQERFWPMSEALFKTQDAWKSRRDVTAFMDSLSRTVPLDRARYERCLRSGEMRPLIAADIERSTRIGVGSTPSFLIGGRPLIGAQPYDAFKRAIDAALAAAPAPAR